MLLSLASTFATQLLLCLTFMTVFDLVIKWNLFSFYSILAVMVYLMIWFAVCAAIIFSRLSILHNQSYTRAKNLLEEINPSFERCISFSSLMLTGIQVLHLPTSKVKSFFFINDKTH